MDLVRSYCRTRFFAFQKSLALESLFFGYIKIEHFKILYVQRVVYYVKLSTKGQTGYMEYHWVACVFRTELFFPVLSAAKSLHYVCGRFWGWIKNKSKCKHKYSGARDESKFVQCVLWAQITMVCHLRFPKPHFQLFRRALFTSIMKQQQHYILQLSTQRLPALTRNETLMKTVSAQTSERFKPHTSRPCSTSFN